MPGNDGLGILVIFEKEDSWDLKLDEASPVCALRDAPRVCWVRWKNCASFSLSSCRKTKLKKSIKVSYLN